MPAADPLDDFDAAPFTDAGVTRTVFRQGRGPAVVLMHELPHITPEAAQLGRRLVAAGYRVHMPSLTGTPGRPFTTLSGAAGIVRMCVSRELGAFAARRAAPITDWLRALCRAAHAESGGPGVGVIGMCMTGGFAITLMADASVIAPVASQPSLPAGPGNARELGLPDEELAVIRRRARDEGVRLLGLRFSHDPLCPRARFERLRAELGDAFEAIELDSSPGNPHGHRRFAHSVLTLDLDDREGTPTRAAVERVMAFLASSLRPGPR